MKKIPVPTYTPYLYEDDRDFGEAKGYAKGWNDCAEKATSEIDRLTRAFASASSRALPDGFVAVPEADKITRKMVAAMLEVVFSGREHLGDPTMRAIYRAAIDTRPEFPNKEPPMLSDYTPRKEEDDALALPPVPEGEYEHISTRGVRFRTHSEIQVLDYGHICRAPLLARIAELEEQIEYDRKRTHGYSQCFVDPIRAERDRLRAEVERLNARLEVNPDAPDCDGIYCRDTTIRMLEGDLREVRAEVEKLRADAEWKLTADGLPEDGRLVLFEVGENNGSFSYLNGQVFGCRFSAAAARHSTGFWTPGLSVCASRWRYAEPPPSIAARKGEGSEPPENCRQRLRAEGKVYPRSSCEACGQFFPKHAGCDALLEAKRAAQAKEGAE